MEILQADPSPTAKRRTGRLAYSVLKKLGEGGFGSVSLVRYKATGEVCVMKEVKLRGLSEHSLRRSREEADVLKRLRHPHLIAYRDSFVEKALTTLFIVMEYADGGDLESLVDTRAAQGERFAEPEVLRLLSQCVSALTYCHHVQHLLHRDIKPGAVQIKTAPLVFTYSTKPCTMALAEKP